MFGNQDVFQQTVGIPMGTSCAPLLADLFLYLYEAEFVQNLLCEKKKSLAMTFNLTFRYIDNVLSINNSYFHTYVDLIYPSELEIKDTTESSISASYLDILVNRDINGKLTTQLYDKQDDFSFSIVNFPYLCSKLTYHHHLHMVCMSHNSFDTQERVLRMAIFFESRQATYKQVVVAGVSTVTFDGIVLQIRFVNFATTYI